jgi:DNA-binding MurR/RpiR family transcriptional regulator
MTEVKAVSIADAAKRIGISPSGVYRLIKAQHLQTKKIFQRQVVLVGSIDTFLHDGEVVQ